MLRASPLGMAIAEGHWGEEARALLRRRMIEARGREWRLLPSRSHQPKGERHDVNYKVNRGSQKTKDFKWENQIFRYWKFQKP